MHTVRFCTVIAIGLFSLAARSFASGPVCEQQTGQLLAPADNVCPSTPLEGQDCAGTSVVAAMFASTQDCFCKGGRSTLIYTGTGTNCINANQSVFDQANSHVICNATTDGLCWESNVIVTTPCFLNAATGLYQESGRLSWKCLYC